MDQLEFIKAVLRVFWEADQTDNLFWNFHEDELHLIAMCSDIFWWGTADGEEILPEDIELLRSCSEQLLEIERSTSIHTNRDDAIATTWLSSLFAAHKRGMRPQLACYSDGMGPRTQALFDECGPERKAGDEDWFRPEMAQPTKFTESGDVWGHGP